jgi:hypothetical protein
MTDGTTSSTVASEVHPNFSLLKVDVDHATVNLVRSRDGLTNWETSTANPIVVPDPAQDSWNCDAVYKPVVVPDRKNNRWLMWYNGRCGGLERIGMSSLDGNSFGSFVERAGPAETLWFSASEGNEIGGEIGTRKVSPI